MKKLTTVFLLLIVGLVWMAQLEAARRGDILKKCYTPHPGVQPPAGLPICPQTLSSSWIKQVLHEYFAEEEKIFPKLKAYLDNESKPPFQLIKQKNLDRMGAARLIGDVDGREAFAKESGINSFLGVANVVAVEKVEPIRSEIARQEGDLKILKEKLGQTDAQLREEWSKRDRLEAELKAKKEEKDKAEEVYNRNQSQAATRVSEIQTQKTDNIQGPIWLYSDKIKLAADKVEDVAKALSTSTSIDAELAKKAMQEAHIDPTALARDMRAVADAVGPLGINDFDGVKQLLQGRYDHAKREHEAILALASKDRAEHEALLREHEAAEKEIRERDASRKWHDQFADNLTAECGKKMLECPVLLAVAAAERAAAAKEQGHIGLLRAGQAFRMPFMMQKGAIVGLNDLAGTPQKLIWEKLKEQMDELDKAKARLEEKIKTEIDRYTNSYEQQGGRKYYETATREYNDALTKYNEQNGLVQKLEKERKGPAEYVHNEEERLNGLKRELVSLESQYTKGGGPSPTAVAAVETRSGQRAVQSLPSPEVFPKKVEYRPAVVPETKPIDFGSPSSRVPSDSKFSRLSKQLQGQDVERKAALDRGMQEFDARRQREKAEFERKMAEALAQKQKELAELERKEKEARLAAEKAKADAEKKAIAEAKKKEQEELARKKAEEELALKKKQEEELALKKKQEEELAKKKAAEELALKKKAEEELAKKQEAERQKKLAEEAAKKKEQEELAARQREMEEAMRQREQEEAARKQREIEQQWGPPPPPEQPEEPAAPPEPEPEPEVVRQEPEPEEGPPQCERGTWSPTFGRCIEDEPVEEEARPDCPSGTHWSPTLRSCQPD